MDADDTEQQTTHQGASGDSASDACDIAPAPRTADIHDDAPTVDFTVSQTRQLPPADGSVAQVGGQSVSEQSDSISLGSSTSTGNQLDHSDAARDPSAASQDVGRPERTADTATTDDTTAQDTSHRARGSKHRGTPGKPSNSKLARRLIAVVAAIVIFLAGAGTAIAITTYRQRQDTARQTAHASNGTTAGAPAKSSRTASAADYIKAMQSFTADADADKLAYQVTGKTTNLAASDTPYGKHGKLSVGTTDGLSAPTILDEHGMPFQLRGASTHGLQWFGQYVNKAAFQSLRDEWGLNMVRLAVYPREGGYLQGLQAQMDKTIEQGVQAATDLGMYVIIDWHVLNYNPNGDVAQAESFFKSYAAKYKSYGNVIFEVCNEPTGTPWYDAQAMTSTATARAWPKPSRTPAAMRSSCAEPIRGRRISTQSQASRSPRTGSTTSCMCCISMPPRTKTICGRSFRSRSMRARRSSSANSGSATLQATAESTRTAPTHG